MLYLCVPLLCVFITSITRVGFVSCACHSPRADNPSSSDSFVCQLPIKFQHTYSVRTCVVIWDYCVMKSVCVLVFVRAK